MTSRKALGRCLYWRARIGFIVRSTSAGYEAPIQTSEHRSAPCGNGAFKHGSEPAAAIDPSLFATTTPPSILAVHGMADLSVQQTFDLALEHLQAGRLAESEQLLRQVLAQSPEHVDAIHCLGVIAYQMRRFDQAIELLRRVIALEPDYAEAHNDLGIVLKDNGDLDAAIAAFRTAIALVPDYPQALHNLSIALKTSGQLDEAIAVFRQLLALHPSDAGTHYNLGNALKDRGDLDGAIAAYRTAISFNPKLAAAHNNLGSALMEQEQSHAAIDAYRQATLLGPADAEAHSNLGKALHASGQHAEAAAAFRAAIDLSPNSADALSNLGIVLNRLGQLDDALAAHERAIALAPNSPDAHRSLGSLLNDIGRMDRAIDSFRKALSLRPTHIQAHSNLLLSLHYPPNLDPSAIAHEHRLWDERHAKPLRQHIQPHANDRDPHRRLRIGYVSPDFREHAVACFLLPLLANHDHQSVEIFAYSQVRRPDAITKRFHTYTDTWRSLVGLSDQLAADQIREDRIDILVDLAGHTADHRLFTFARKPAPVQVTYLGYPDTTGLATMDYRLTDAYADPPGLTEPYHAEKLIRLDPCAWCFAGPASPDLSPRSHGPITFGSFNTFAKVNEPLLDLWSQILLSVPNSRLFLKSPGLGSAKVCQEVRQRFADWGIDPKRLELRGRESGYKNHLALYGQMDIALDTFPYHGTTTTCEALWMGVPVISLAGSSHVSRVGVSLLSNVGLPELIAATPEEYVHLAVNLAKDPPCLNELHATLRQRMEQSPLMDAPRFARNIEAAYRQMWRTWCEAVHTAP